MAAIGVLAPTIESLFVAVYRGIADFRPPVMPVTPSGVRAAFSDDPRFWDPRFVYSRQGRSKNLVRGLLQLADATGLGPYLPSNLPMMLDALFRYRNKMFHHGFEWPPLERDRFEGTIASEGWPADWFTRSTSGHRTWIIYMSDVLIDHAIAQIDQTLEGIGRFVRSRYPSAPNA
jgi:hypothetical protein